VASLARPGGNVTGLSVRLTELVTKQLEIMKQALPHMSRVGMLLTSMAPSHLPASQAVEAAAPKLGLQVLKLTVQTPGDLDGASARMARERVDGVLAISSALTRSERVRLAELSLRHRVAAMYGARENVETADSSVTRQISLTGLADPRPTSTRS